jgi:hypothetical protein
MPPHCDTLDGPVVRAAARALEGRDAALVLPYYLPCEGEDESAPSEAHHHSHPE